MKIYIVKSSEGTWDDYHSWNEKAFISEEKAEEYAKELDKKHYQKPTFLTNEFERLFDIADEIFSEENEWPDYKDPNYDKCAEKFEKENQEFIIQYMSERGITVTSEILNEYDDWRSDGCYRDWHDCEIEEIELVE